MPLFMELQMSGMMKRLLSVAAVGILTTQPLFAVDLWGLQPQSIKLESAGPLAFGPTGILFVGDPKSATLYAIDSKDAIGTVASTASSWSTTDIEDLRVNIASAAGPNINAESVEVVDLAVDPESGNAIVSAMANATPVLCSVSQSGEVKVISLDKVLASKITLPDPPADKVTGEGRRASNKRMESITDLAFAEGRVLASGLSGSDNASTVLAFDFPFRETSVGTDLQIYHGAHGRVEDTAAVRSFVPMMIDGKPSVLAGFTCTPLVQFSLEDLRSGAKAKGKTVAELGNWNKPLDMISYEKNGHPYVLVANTARGLMKVDVANVATQEPITDRVPDGGTKGLPFEKIESLPGVTQLAKIDDSHALIVSELPSKQLRLTAIELP
jgi:hypothetical protein